MTKRPRTINNISSQMFDVRPTNTHGEVNWGRVHAIKRTDYTAQRNAYIPKKDDRKQQEDCPKEVVIDEKEKASTSTESFLSKKVLNEDIEKIQKKEKKSIKIVRPGERIAIPDFFFQDEEQKNSNSERRNFARKTTEGAKIKKSFYTSVKKGEGTKEVSQSVDIQEKTTQKNEEETHQEVEKRSDVTNDAGGSWKKEVDSETVKVSLVKKPRQEKVSPRAVTPERNPFRTVEGSQKKKEVLVQKDDEINSWAKTAQEKAWLAQELQSKNFEVGNHSTQLQKKHDQRVGNGIEGEKSTNYDYHKTISWVKTAQERVLQKQEIRGRKIIDDRQAQEKNLFKKDQQQHLQTKNLFVEQRNVEQEGGAKSAETSHGNKHATVYTQKKENPTKTKEEDDEKMRAWFNKKEKKVLSEEKIEKSAQPRSLWKWLSKKVSKRSQYKDYKRIRSRSLLKTESRTIFRRFAIGAVCIAFCVGMATYVNKAIVVKGAVLGASNSAQKSLEEAIGALRNQDFDTSQTALINAAEDFSLASKEMDSLGATIVDMSRYIPVVSQMSSGKNMASAGENLSKAAASFAVVGKEVTQIQNPFTKDTEGDKTLLDRLFVIEENLNQAHIALVQAEQDLSKVKNKHVPEEYREQFVALRTSMPLVVSVVEKVLDNTHVLEDVFGKNGPRKYLFLFQNNHEIRPTGGFIGSYAIVDISNGVIRDFFVDGIFNPDGQLRDKIVPPIPIQKVSASWSLHDSNWFPHFPLSAQKAMTFYEKTGGSTVDGVIAVTPEVIKDMLKVTGPINMPQYDVVLSAENFVEKTQYEVEVEYDKEENSPKKILDDMAPILLEKMFSSAKNTDGAMGIVNLFSKAIKEKNLLLYARNEGMQEIIEKNGWGGIMQETQYDYLSVINTNINGYKTDGVVDETIDLESEIDNDGRIVNTVTITRKHRGGYEDYEWWNKVNADYMRVYVPKGAQLIEAKGYTQEVVEPPLDYDALGFERDEDVARQESAMRIDQESGTKIYEENNKTVFANWVYVSPQETVTVTYKYVLPFYVDVHETEDGTYFPHSMLVQKQSGAMRTNLTTKISLPENYVFYWVSQEEERGKQELSTQMNLNKDVYIGFIAKKE
ncbi:MAG: DUF4012 domain-containing protein [Candidatus Moranbacteria bacterium]|nr:DUF4012 domain-containing protein [Candidatus Moranbacteria bacterium]